MPPIMLTEIIKKILVFSLEEYMVIIGYILSGKPA
jgi:hypothetical protein